MIDNRHHAGDGAEQRRQSSHKVISATDGRETGGIVQHERRKSNFSRQQLNFDGDASDPALLGAPSFTHPEIFAPASFPA